MNNKKLQNNKRFTLYSRASSLHSKGGFTLIEIMVSVAIFAIIMTTGIGALVSLTNSYKQSQKNKQVNDALNYALETMTREIRLGRNYFAGASSDASQGSFTDGNSDSLGFDATDDRGYVIYRVDSNGVLFRDNYDGPTGGDSFDALTTPEEVEITKLEFTVIGTDPLTGSPNDYQQPLVWVQVQAESPDGGKISSVQTLVSQRLLDA